MKFILSKFFWISNVQVQLKLILGFMFWDSVNAWQMKFQDPATGVMEGIINFHHDLMFFLIILGVFVFYMLYVIVSSFNIYNNNTYFMYGEKNHNDVLETVWTIIPTLILMLIALPSFSLLYSLEEVIKPFLTLKAVGHQWYWHYEYTDGVQNNYYDQLGNIVINSSGFKNFESYLQQEDNLELGELRLLTTDNKVYLPSQVHIRILTSAADVLHSWAIPSLGVKLDACPGRMNECTLFLKREGNFYGQCSEICGVNHGFMPIEIQGLSVYDYTAWFSKNPMDI